MDLVRLNCLIAHNRTFELLATLLTIESRFILSLLFFALSLISCKPKTCCQQNYRHRRLNGAFRYRQHVTLSSIYSFSEWDDQNKQQNSYECYNIFSLNTSNPYGQ